MKVCCFISDHGFGHAARTSNVVRALVDRGHKVCIITKVPLFFIEESVGMPCSVVENGDSFKGQEAKTYVIPTQVDVGVIQPTSVEIDWSTTIKSLETFWDESLIEKKIADLSRLLDDFDPDVAIGDVPAFCPVFSSRYKKNLPSIMFSNFEWGWIYSASNKGYPELNKYINLHKLHYSKASLFVALPFAAEACIANCGIANSKVKKLSSLLLRKSKLQDKSIVRNWILEHYVDQGDSRKHAKMLLFSFGGFDFPLNLGVWDIPVDWVVVHIQRDKSLVARNDPPGFFAIQQDELSKNNISYADLVSAMDVIALKTGYGIVGEVIANGVPALYVDRPGFIEHEEMVKALEGEVFAERIEIEDAKNGNVFDLANLVHSRMTQKKLLFEQANGRKWQPSIGLEGADELAEEIENFVKRKGQQS